MKLYTSMNLRFACLDLKSRHQCGEYLCSKARIHVEVSRMVAIYQLHICCPLSFFVMTQTHPFLTPPLRQNYFFGLIFDANYRRPSIL